MNSSNKISHELTNNVEAILNALEAVELKLESKDVKGALHTLQLIKDKKEMAMKTLEKVNQLINTVKAVSNPIIRPMNIEDAYQVAKIHTESWQAAYKGIMDQSVLDSLDINKRASSWADGIKNDPTLVRLVAEIDGEIKGFAVGLKNRSFPNPDSEGELWAIYVDPKTTQSGIGTSLFTSLSIELGKRGMNSMCVWVLEDNKQARNFYEKMGGTLTQENKTFKAGSKEHLEVCYVFPIERSL